MDTVIEQEQIYYLSKEKIYQRNYYLVNREKLLTKANIYYKANRENILKKINKYQNFNHDNIKNYNSNYKKHLYMVECFCGAKYKFSNYSQVRHEKSKKHLNYIKYID